MPLVDRVAVVVEVYVVVCQLRLCNTTLATALWSQSIYRYVLVLLYIVGNAGRNYIEIGREGLIFNDLSFFSH